ncbi:unnamed protein product [Enterobius vermicularis]|uniref:7-dehydrocholesterol reductase n=1 Tax=Enterobius vermicularis TaxID=51028 RepID=A0A0N4VII2_ENTVE|nr:unnamed protein product [Enterobius vermicularis]
MPRTDAICDIFFGTELSPILYTVDVKHFITYRIAFPLWALYDVSAIYHNSGLYGNVNVCLIGCVVLHLTYIGRSEWFEYLHYTRLDFQYDKAGSGWWCFSRHLNYLMEWLSFVFWTLIQGESTFLSYLPLVFLGVFLYFRMRRDEMRCLAKYGQYWLQYTNRVPFLLVPNVY